MKKSRVATRRFAFIVFLIASFLCFGGSPSTFAAATQSENPPQAQPAAKPEQQLSQEKAADLHMARKEYAEAAEIYKRLLEREPHNAVYLNKLGIAYHQQTQLKMAIRYYEKAAKADRNYADPVNNIGTIHYQRKKYGKAIKAYRKALEIHPDMASVLSNLGYAYFSDKRYPEAIEAFQRALTLDPTVFDRSSRTGSVLQDRSVENRGLFFFLMAKTYAQAGNAERCLFYLRKARDEGYASFASVKTDPAFAAVVKDPAVQEFLAPPASEAAKP
jgi:tetratricopeptide (TPR) repeat protein